MSVRKLFLMFVLSVLIVPGMAFGAITLQMDYPPQVTKGQVFEITVMIVGTEGAVDPSPICGYMTFLGYNPQLLELTEYRAETFFEVAGPGMPEIYTPIGPSTVTALGEFGSLSIFNVFDQTPVFWPYNGKTASFTFKALMDGPVQFNLINDGGTKNLVNDCVLFDDKPIDGPPINEQEKPAPVPENVPTLNQYGMAFLILAMALFGLRIIRRKNAA